MSLTDSTQMDNSKIQPENNSMQPTLRDSVESTLRTYLTQLDGQTITNLYDLVLTEVEAPLLEAVMKHTRGNQTHASALLGLNRGTLRKKLKNHGL